MLERRTILVEGRTISYARVGTGPVVVLLHGIGGNAGQWAHQFGGIADAYDLIAWDAPGYGRSDDPGAEWTLADYADCLAGFLDALGLEQVHLVGQSWGGVLAQEMHRRHAARLRSLVLADTLPGGAQPEEERRAALDARLRSLETMTPAEMSRARIGALVGRDTAPETLAEIEQMLAEIRPSGYRRAAIVLAEADTLDTLPTVHIPTLVIAGELDQIVPMELAMQLRDTIPNAGWIVIRDAGHLGGQERPRQFNAALRGFLDGIA